MRIAVSAFLALTLLGCAVFKSNDAEPLTGKEKTAIAAIEQQESSGKLTSMEADMEKDSAAGSSHIRF